MANKIKLKRGAEADLPTLDVGEPAFTTDTKKPFIGSDTGNIELATKEQINNLVSVNVKNFGAKGDGVTDDRPAILAAFDYALTHLPADVFFPIGEYGINGCIYINMPLGSGGLTIRGAGASLSRIKYLETWTPASGWVALRFMPIGDNPSSEADYIHDITIKDLGVIDTNPIAHATEAEETHGFSVHYCKNFIMKNCGVWSVGDEGIEINSCKNAIIDGNYFFNSPGSGGSGGSISVADGCEDVKVINNHITSTIATKTNFGISIESNKAYEVKNVIIANNTITNIVGNGINIAPNSAKISNLEIIGNTINNCTNGIASISSSGIANLGIKNNIITNCNKAISLEALNTSNVLIDGLIADTISDICIYVKSFSGSSIINSILKNLQKQAIWFDGNDVKIDNLLIDGVGLATGITAGAIQQFTGGLTSVVSNTKIINCKTKYCIQSVETVINTDIKMDELTGYVAIASPKFVQGGTINGVITSVKNNGIIRGVTINMANDAGNHGIILASVTNCIVSECNITIPSRYGISETGTSDYNIIANNNVRNAALGSGIVKIGTNTILANNQLRVV